MPNIFREIICRLESVIINFRRYVDASFQSVFTARRRAKRGICRRRVSVCVCCHTPVFYQNG